MPKWTVNVVPLPGPFEIDVTWPDPNNPQGPPLTATIKMMDGGQANFVASAISTKLLETFGPA